MVLTSGSCGAVHYLFSICGELELFSICGDTENTTDPEQSALPNPALGMWAGQDDLQSSHPTSIFLSVFN